MKLTKLAKVQLEMARGPGKRTVMEMAKLPTELELANVATELELANVATGMMEMANVATVKANVLMQSQHWPTQTMLRQKWP